MKKLFVLLLLLMPSLAIGQPRDLHSRVIKPIIIRPADAEQKSLYDRWTPLLSPSSKRKLVASASSIEKQLKDNPQNTDVVKLARDGVASQFPNLQGMAIEDAVMLMMMLVSQDAEKDMQNMLDEMNKTRRQKQAVRDATDKLTDMSEETQLKLQMMMDRREKALEAISNMMKKMDDTQDSIIKNIK